MFYLKLRTKPVLHCGLLYMESKGFVKNLSFILLSKGKEVEGIWQKSKHKSNTFIFEKMNTS